MYCKELNMEFEHRKDMFKALKESKDEIIGLKKSKIRKSQSINLIIKGDGTKKDAEPKRLELGDWIKNAINTTNYFDYDRDVLLSGSWDKTAVEQNGKTYHLINHKQELGSIVAYPKDVKVSVEKLDWTSLGKSFGGKTEVLVFLSKMTEKTNKDAFLAYRDGEPIEHSASLQYLQIELAMKSDDPNDKEENQRYEKYYPVIANKEDVDEYEYFWAVLEVKLQKEGSTVLFGANDATPPLKENNSQPLKDTDDKIVQSQKSTGEIDYDYLIKEIKKFKN